MPNFFDDDLTDIDLGTDRWIGTEKAAEYVGVTARAIRYWARTSLVKVRDESRAAQRRRPKMYVWLSDVVRCADNLGCNKFPAGYWGQRDTTAMGVQYQPDPNVVTLQDLFGDHNVQDALATLPDDAIWGDGQIPAVNPPQSMYRDVADTMDAVTHKVQKPQVTPPITLMTQRQMRDDIIKAAIAEQAQCTAEAIALACADADDWSNLPDCTPAVVAPYLGLAEDTYAREAREVELSEQNHRILNQLSQLQAEVEIYKDAVQRLKAAGREAVEALADVLN